MIATRGSEVQRLMDKLYTIEQAASHLGVSYMTIRRLIRLGLLTTVKVGRKVRIREDSIINYTNSEEHNG